MYDGASVSVVFPALNEAESIVEAVRSAIATGFVDEVIVVDNNSSDGTGRLARAAGARVVPCKPQGYGHALQAGMRAATGDWIVLCEPDGTFDLKDLRKLLAYTDDFDVVLGTRTNADLIWAGANMRWANRMGNLAVAKLLEWLFNGPDLTDVGCTFRVLSRRAYEQLADHLTVGGSHFLPEVVILSLLTRQRVIEVPVNYRSRQGKSKITGTHSGLVRVGAAMVSLILSYRARLEFEGWHPIEAMRPRLVCRPAGRTIAALAVAAVLLFLAVAVLHVNDPAQGDDFDFISAALGVRDGHGLTYFRAYIADGTQARFGHEAGALQVWAFHPPGSIYLLALFQSLIPNPVVAARVMNVVFAAATLAILPYAYRRFYPDDTSNGAPLTAIALLAAAGTFVIGPVVVDADTCLLPFLWITLWTLYFDWAQRGSRRTVVMLALCLLATFLVKATHVLLFPVLIALDLLLRGRWRAALALPLASALVGAVGLVVWATLLRDTPASPWDAFLYYRSQTQPFLTGVERLLLNGNLITHAGYLLAIGPPLLAIIALARFIRRRRTYHAEVVLLIGAVWIWGVYLAKPSSFRYHSSSLAPLALIAAHHTWHAVGGSRAIRPLTALLLGGGVITFLVYGHEPFREFWGHNAMPPWLVPTVLASVLGFLVFRIWNEPVAKCLGAAVLSGHLVISVAIVVALATQRGPVWHVGYGDRERAETVDKVRRRLGPERYLWSDPGYVFSLGHQRVIWSWGSPRFQASKSEQLVYYQARDGLLPVGVAIIGHGDSEKARHFIDQGYCAEALPNSQTMFWRGLVACDAREEGRQ